MSDWEVSGNLIANNQQLNGASYSGSQLGTPRSAMKFMGTTYCHASVGTGDDNRILMGYSYQPKEVRVELFGWRLSRKQIIFVLAGGVVEEAYGGEKIRVRRKNSHPCLQTRRPFLT